MFLTRKHNSEVLYSALMRGCFCISDPLSVAVSSGSEDLSSCGNSRSPAESSCEYNPLSSECDRDLEAHVDDAEELGEKPTAVASESDAWSLEASSYTESSIVSTIACRRARSY